ncbi:amidase [Oceanibium sediminis]|uniref:amidase n=1 Tax=Oceanibium sediminis TaxID=2026339 RepID=UPI000DD33296|nr:amidase [Oceanibium sediminis]
MGAGYWKLGAADLSAAYRDGRADPILVIDELERRIAALNPRINAYVALAGDLGAQAEASQRRWRAGQPLSPLDGVPVAVKDNLNVAGLPTTWGGHTFDDIPDTDELPVARLRAAGAILVGKTNTPEFAVEGYTANARYGVTRNPWDLALTPGGSSGGSVAAVSAGLATLAIGTDGGGSTRRPAGHTGLFGLKPTIGQIPRGGGLPQILMDFEVIGTFVRDPGDLHLLHDILAGPDRGDPMSRRVWPTGDDPQSLRVLSVPLLDDNPCDPEILSSTRALARQLSDLGHHVVEGALPLDLEAVNAFWGGFAQVGLAHIRATVPRMRSQSSQQYLDMADGGDALQARELFAAIEAVQRLRADTSRLFKHWDVILMPTAAAQPWPAEQSHPEVIDGKPVGPRGHAIYTGWVNASGHPGLAVPAGVDRAGLPIGCQLIGDLGSDASLMRLAAALAAEGEGWQWPALADTSADRVQSE